MSNWNLLCIYFVWDKNYLSTWFQAIDWDLLCILYFLRCIITCLFLNHLQIFLDIITLRSLIESVPLISTVYFLLSGIICLESFSHVITGGGIPLVSHGMLYDCPTVDVRRLVSLLIIGGTETKFIMFLVKP